VDLHRLGELRSIEYHRAIVARLDASLVERVKRRLSAAATHAALVDQWRSLLDLPPQQLATKLVEDSPEMARLRSCSPFAGELPPRERWRLWREVRDRHEAR
jgi:hypothetical protein